MNYWELWPLSRTIASATRRNYPSGSNLPISNTNPPKPWIFRYTCRRKRNLVWSGKGPGSRWRLWEMRPDRPTTTTITTITARNAVRGGVALQQLISRGRPQSSKTPLRELTIRSRISSKIVVSPRSKCQLLSYPTTLGRFWLKRKRKARVMYPSNWGPRSCSDKERLNWLN